ncbi:MAG TPA: glycosyltransferase [Gammaproteobacteria bacterium]|nr:glycosyltransferase [Gammaproteobacteria bacterium]
MNDPLVSVSIFSYNSERFIEQCLQSVLTQDYSNFEIVISDDASTDETGSIIHAYQKKYPNIIKLYCNASNLGVTKNANVSLLHCTGKYIAFLGADDLMLPEKLKKQVEYMESHPECSICYHDVEVFFHNDPKKKSFLHHHAAKPREGKVNVAIKYGPFNAGCATMVLRKKIPSYGYDERLKVAADGLLWVEILASGGEIHYLNKILARYRIHNKNVSKLMCVEIAFDFLIHHSKLLMKYPHYSSIILNNYADSLFMAAKYSSNSLYYLKTSFKIKKSLKTFLLIFLHYASLGKCSFNSKLMRQVNEFITNTRIRINALIY